MVKFLILGLLFSVQSFATIVTANGGSPGIALPYELEQKLNTSATAGPLVRLGTQITQKKVLVLKAVYDFTKLGGNAGVSYILKDAVGGNAVLPKYAVIKDCVIQVLTAPTGTSATISLGATTASDLKAATAITSYTTSGLVTCIPVGSAATMIKVGSSNVNVTASIATTTLTAGKFNVYIEYYMGN